MVRYSIPVIVGCLYLAGSVWLVRNEGRAYRESLRRARPVASATGPPPAGQDPEVEVAKREGAIAEPAGRSKERPPAQTVPVPEAPSKAEVAEGMGSPPPGAGATPPPTTVTAKPATEDTAQPTTKNLTADIARWKNDPIWSQATLARPWDLDHLTPHDENELGELLNGLILQLNPEDRGPGLRRVKEAARPLLDLVQPKDREYRFYVLNSEVANAFSHPGGYIYISRKLLERIPEGEDYLLEFVIGHEMAHVELQHALACLRAPDVRRFSDSALQKLYFLIIPHGYPDKLEYDADAWVYHRMKRLRRSEHDCLKFLRILDNYAKAHGFEHGRGKPEELLKKKPDDPEAVQAVSPIDNHLRSHPAAYERLSRLKKLSEQVSHSTK